MGGKTSAASINKYKQKTYDRIELLVRKGEKETIKEHAKQYYNNSVNAFINRAIKNQIKLDSENTN